jgi:hypothetical protein
VDRVGLYYGPTVKRFVINGEEIEEDDVYKVFPVRSSSLLPLTLP